MNSKGLIITTIIFFLLVNTTYYWEGKVGLLSFPAFLLLVVVYFGLLIALLRQLFLTVKEKFKDKQRLYGICLLTIVLTLTFFRPRGLVNFETLEGSDILVAQRRGAANCMTTFKLKENNKFTEKSICFGVTEVKGDYKIINDTIYFENVELGRDNDVFFKFAVIKKSEFEWNKDGYELFRYKNSNDTVGQYLTITLNEISKLSKEKPNR